MEIYDDDRGYIEFDKMARESPIMHIYTQVTHVLIPVPHGVDLALQCRVIGSHRFHVTRESVKVTQSL